MSVTLSFWDNGSDLLAVKYSLHVVSPTLELDSSGY